MAEVDAETTYVRHHKKKIAFIFSAMRHFGAELSKAGWSVDYVKLDDDDNSGALDGEILRAIERHGVKKVLITEPGEWRLLDQLKTMSAHAKAAVEIVEDDRFIVSHDQFKDWAHGRKQMRMENFYREIRRETNLLMDDDQPCGGQWNFDKENRKPPKKGLNSSGPKRFRNDEITKEVLQLVDQRFPQHFGTLEPFWFGVTRRQALTAFQHFVDNSLAGFGDYQDAMLGDDQFLFHSVISMYLNVGLLEPVELCRKVEQAWEQDKIPLNAAEGFIRQIIGWREYIRGIYWLRMPAYLDQNYFNHTRDLPDFYWSGETNMRCLQLCITQTAEQAYTHHIQRLMITGNFALLIGTSPVAIHEWYLMVYADAFEWVELPNTLGMSQFADGGLLASKPYVSSGNYINKMSDYCADCHFDVKQKTGETACPYNYLYWDFLIRHRDKLSKNHRMAQIYRNLERMNDDRVVEIKKDANRFLRSLS